MRPLQAWFEGNIEIPTTFPLTRPLKYIASGNREYKEKRVPSFSFLAVALLGCLNKILIARPAVWISLFWVPICSSTSNASVDTTPQLSPTRPPAPTLEQLFLPGKVLTPVTYPFLTAAAAAAPSPQSPLSTGVPMLAFAARPLIF